MACARNNVDSRRGRRGSRMCRRFLWILDISLRVLGGNNYEDSGRDFGSGYNYNSASDDKYAASKNY